MQMFEIIGRYNTAVVYANAIDSNSYAQILEMCNNEKLKNSRIRMMPDTHASSGCLVGTSITFDECVNPSFIGDDIGCGMQVYKLEEKETDFARLDEVIHTMIPSGTTIHEKSPSELSRVPLDGLFCFDFLRHDTVNRSFGTLGGGNHFVEMDKAPDGTLYIVIHSGSRFLGRNVSRYHKMQAFFTTNGIDPSEGRKKKMTPEGAVAKTPIERCFLTGENRDKYLHDMNIAVKYAAESRKLMGETIVDAMGYHVAETFTTIHNYIDTEKKVLRKGAVSAAKGERLIIPINMRDGSLICRGKGNPEWNYTAPHGSGRVLNRAEAKSLIDIDEFRSVMEGIYSTSVNESTIDESPMAYRRIDDILSVLSPTAEVVERLVPVYNFKSSKPDIE